MDRQDIHRIPVESSDIVSIGYDEPSRILEVEFRGGRLYQYQEVPPEIHAQFMRADSYGQFFSTFINRRYRYIKIEKKNGSVDVSGPIAFVTGNAIKFGQMKEVCEPFGIEVEQHNLPVDEIQSDNPEDIAVKKAKLAFKLAGRPVVVNDSYWNILALRGFPGAYMSAVEKWLRPEDFLVLMQGKTDRDILLTETVVYHDGKRTKIFAREHRGSITYEPAGSPKGGSESAIGQIVILEGQTQTITEVWRAGGYNISAKDSSFYQFAKWFNMHRKIGR